MYKEVISSCPIFGSKLTSSIKQRDLWKLRFFTINHLNFLMPQERLKHNIACNQFVCFYILLQIQELYSNAQLILANDRNCIVLTIYTAELLEHLQFNDDVKSFKVVIIIR